MSDTFITHLWKFPWLIYYVDPLESAIQVRVKVGSRTVDYSVPRDLFVTTTGNQEFMRLAFAHLRCLQAEQEAIDRVTKELLR